MLSGLLYPTSGEALVLGFEPSKRSKDYLRQITLVMGNRNQLAWDLPAVDSFELQRAIYAIPLPDYRRTLDEYIELLELKELINKPVRNLSLGERMKVEIAGSLLHRPAVLFLDEPTIGLDVTMQRRIRTFVAEYNRRTGRLSCSPATTWQMSKQQTSYRYSLRSPALRRRPQPACRRFCLQDRECHFPGAKPTYRLWWVISQQGGALLRACPKPIRPR
jgi:ABC-type transport system involved in cytochrome c biogenesis ATPase subunit